MGWASFSVNRCLSMVRDWNRLINMDSERLTEKTNNTINFHQVTECQIDQIQFSIEWLTCLDLFKRTFCAEHDVMNTISRSRRSPFIH